ncbi:MAG TPA: twin-arginine translocase TatA/TatE family subunit [Acidimicrobiales bacterium]|nr:twin-arginine translocase TatA/TatE family subunit [Acidimicrobiales bacterium]
MLDLSPDKILMLAVVALVVLGPNRLPGAARTLGRLVSQLRAMSSSLQTEVRDALHDPEDAFSSALADFRPGDFRPGEVRRSVRRMVTDTIAPASAMSGSVGARAENLPTGSTPSALPPVGSEIAGPVPIGWGGRPTPDDPAFN